MMALATDAAYCAGEASTQEITGTLKNIKETGAITLGHRDSSIPFSYLDDNQKPIGFAMDICYKIVDAVKKELKLDKLEVKLNPVNSQTRIPLVANGTVDLECGSTTNNAERQKQVSFSPIIFVAGTKLMVKRASKVKSYRDLAGHSVVVTEGTTNEAAMKSLDEKNRWGLRLASVRDHDQAFETLDKGGADAWANDDVLLYSYQVQA